jgi:UDP-N-acetylglucosamine 1-carboxyvinyltransferase
MSKFIVNGPSIISGEANPVGNKNSVLKLIPASILFKGDYKLTNVPAISDVQIMLDILEQMGATVEYDKNAQTVVINTDDLQNSHVPDDLAKKLRASVLFIGPLLARFGEVSAIFPGGDKIGSRELKAHFSGLVQLGGQFEGNEWGEFKLTGKLSGADVLLYEPSVTATENLILAAAGAPGTTVITGAACEPHVQELCRLLADSGISIKGIGSNVLTIEGRDMTDSSNRLEQMPDSHAIWPDYLDVATLAVAGLITGGEMLIKDVRHEDLRTIKFFYDQLGVEMKEQGEDLLIPGEQNLKVKDPNWARTKGIYSQPWYSFPSDLMSITIVLAMYVEGTVLFFEKLYENRMAFIEYFNAAGGNIFFCDTRRVIVSGPTTLKGFTYNAPDLRAGMAYFLASLTANGESIIHGADHIDRGYPDTHLRYQQLGADVSREE